VVEGRTYLPLRAMGDALGVPVNWNEELKQAEVGNSSPVAKSDEYSRNNPAPINTVQTVKEESFLGNNTVAVRIVEVIRGENAAAMVKNANMFNNPAEEGKEYIVVKIAVSALEVEDDKSVNINGYSFSCFSQNNEKYDSSLVVAPQPALDATLYAGGNAEGYVVFKVRQNDPAPKIAYGLKYDGTGGGWFSLQ